MPKDRVTQQHQSYGFVEFMSEEDADYAIKVMNMIKLYGKPIRVNKVRSKIHRMVASHSHCSVLAKVQQHCVALTKKRRATLKVTLLTICSFGCPFLFLYLF